MSINIYLYPGADKEDGEARMRACARHFCEQEKYAQNSFERILRTQKGKPYFPDAPGIHCSISHTNGYWACAVSQKPVGLDIEKIRPCAADKIARRFFHSQEAAFASKSERNFFEIWTAKESYVKLLGSGIDASFGHFSVVQGEELAERLGEYAFLPIALGPEYCMCLCASDLEEVQCIFREDELR